MDEPMEAAIRHAKFLSKYLRKCDCEYIIRIALKELGVPSGQDGFQYMKNSVLMLLENPFQTLKNGIYLAVGLMRKPPAGQNQVESAVRFGIHTAWGRRNPQLWVYYFPEEDQESMERPSSRDFMMAIVDFVELWKACCEEEVCYESA